MRLLAVQSLIGSAVRSCWVTSSRHDLGHFRPVRAVFRALPSPVLASSAGSSSHLLCSSSELGPPYRTRLRERAWLTSRRVSLSWATSIEESTNQLPGRAAYPRDPCSVLSVPPALDGLLLFNLCGFVSLHSHLRFLFRGFPRQPAVPALTGHFLHDVTSRCLQRPKPLRQLCETRLQDVVPTAGPWSWAGGLDQPIPRSPLEFSTPAGLSPDT